MHIVFCGSGGSALVARFLGEKNKRRANEVFSFLIYATIVAGILLSIAGWFVIPSFARILGAGWPTMHKTFGVSSSYAGYVSMTIAFMTIISALLSPKLIQKVHTKWIVAASISLTVAGLLGFSLSSAYFMLFLFAVPYGLGAGAIDAAVNHMAPSKFGKEYSASAIGLQMASAYVGTTFMPMVFGILQEKFGIWIMPWYILFFMFINFFISTFII